MVSPEPRSRTKKSGGVTGLAPHCTRSVVERLPELGEETTLAAAGVNILVTQVGELAKQLLLSFVQPGRRSDLDVNM